MVWGAIAGALGGSAASGAMTALQTSRQRHFQKKMMQNKIQWQMEDMRKAGLNPILAYKTATGMGAGGGPGQFPDLGQTISTARKTGAEVGLKGEQARLARFQNRLIVAQTAKTVADTGYVNKQTDMLGWKEPGAIAGKWAADIMRGGKENLKKANRWYEVKLNEASARDRASQDALERGKYINRLKKKFPKGIPRRK